MGYHISFGSPFGGNYQFKTVKQQPIPQGTPGFLLQPTGGDSFTLAAARSTFGAHATNGPKLFPASKSTKDIVNQIALSDPHLAADSFGLNPTTLFGLTTLF